MADVKVGGGGGYDWIDPLLIRIIKNPRTVHNPGFGEEKMQELYRSIARDGLNHPLSICVCSWTPQRELRLIGGERRLRTILRMREENAEVRDPRGSGAMLPATTAYATVPCKLVHCESEREARRLARQDNLLHEQLTDFEILLDVEEMEKDGYTRAEQAEDFGKSEAWVSQSHSLLSLCVEFGAIRDAMFRGELGRTQALHFLPIWDKTPDKVLEVFNTARENRFLALREKEQAALKEEELANLDFDLSESELRMAELDQDPDGIALANRKVRRAGQRIKQAANKVQQTRSNLDSPELTVEDITRAAQQTRGTEDVLNKPQTVKNVRVFSGEVKQILEENSDGELTILNRRLRRDDVKLMLRAMEWFVGSVRANHPLDLLEGAEV